MSLDKIKKEIIKQAEREAASIMGQAERERDEIIAEAEKELAEIRKNKGSYLKKELEMMEKKLAASNELELKKAVLTEKKRVVDEVFKEAEKRLASLPKAEMKKRLAKLIASAQKDISIGSVLCNRRDIELIGEKGVPADISGGIIARSPDGNVSVDLCFEGLLNEYKEKNIEAISASLFGK